MPIRNEEFDLKGVNHVALVCRDMERTVAFYSGVLGMPLVKTIELPFGGGQHFFFDIGNGDCLAFFWFADAVAPAPGVASAGALPGLPEFLSAIGSMNHLAFDVDPDRFDEYVERLASKGVECSGILNHDDSEPRRLEAAALWHLRPIGLLLRPRWDTPRVRGLDVPAQRGRRAPRSGERTS